MEKQIRQGKNREKISGRTAISEALQICVRDANFKDYSLGLGKLRNQKDCKPFRLQSFFWWRQRGSKLRFVRLLRKPFAFFVGCGSA